MSSRVAGRTLKLNNWEEEAEEPSLQDDTSMEEAPMLLDPSEIREDDPFGDGGSKPPMASREAANLPVRGFDVRPNRQFQLGEMVYTIEASMGRDYPMAGKVVELVADEEVVVQFPNGMVVQYGFDELMGVGDDAWNIPMRGRRKASASKKTRRIACRALSQMASEIESRGYAPQAEAVRTATVVALDIDNLFGQRPSAIPKSSVAAPALRSATVKVAKAVKTLVERGHHALADEVATTWMSALNYDKS